MRREPKYVASFFLSAALLAPVEAFARPLPEDDREARKERERKVYDPVPEAPGRVLEMAPQP